MINANELRIGNLVSNEFYEHFKTKIEVFSINDKGINLEIEDDIKWYEIVNRFIAPEYTFEKLYGIPLTEEWLLNFGFDEVYSSWYRIRYDHTCNFIGFDISKTDDKSMEGLRYYENYVKIKYVHQLQNLFFALTGEELKLKE